MHEGGRLERMAPLRSLLEAGITFQIEGTDPDNKQLAIVKDAVTRIDRKFSTVEGLIFIDDFE